jgi:hypothetical protein
MLCCVMPMGHLGSPHAMTQAISRGKPNKKDVKDGVIGACARPPFAARRMVAATPKERLSLVARRRTP